MPSCINVIHDIILTFKNYLVNHQKNKNKNSPWVQRTKMWTRGEWNEWILHEWMEQMNIPWMNGTTEYSLNEWNDWIFREWMERLNIPRPGRGVSSANTKRSTTFYYERFELLPYSSPSLYLSFSLCGLCTQQLEIANSVAAFKLFVMVEKTSRRDLQILIWDYLWTFFTIWVARIFFGSWDFVMGVSQCTLSPSVFNYIGFAEKQQLPHFLLPAYSSLLSPSPQAPRRPTSFFNSSQDVRLHCNPQDSHPHAAYSSSSSSSSSSSCCTTWNRTSRVFGWTSDIQGFIAGQLLLVAGSLSVKKLQEEAMDLEELMISGLCTGDRDGGSTGGSDDGWSGEGGGGGGGRFGDHHSGDGEIPGDG